MSQIPAPKPAAERLVSLDALRGFDMLWIIGADAIGDALSHFRGGVPARVIAGQLDHVPWQGFHAYDLIFPLFVFMAGVSLPLSLARIEASGGVDGALRRIFRRTVVLYVIGILYYGGLSTSIHDIRLLGVLQRIALCYGISGILYLNLGARELLVAVGLILVGYWAALAFIPVPGFGPGDYAEGHNLTNWIDSHYLPFRKWDGDHDPEGILSTFPAVATCLLGVLSSLWLAREDQQKVIRAGGLLVAGLLLVAVGHAWGQSFPVIKKIWTSSFVLVAGGWSACLLGFFYLVVDVIGFRSWAMPFVWVGSNSLAIYLISNIVDFGKLSERFAGGDMERALNGLWPGLGGVVVTAIGIVFCFGLCRLLYNRKLFLRI
jgi:predicted acyltransferase